MFYGGWLFCYLSVGDEEVGEFVFFCFLNRNICIVIDSDKEKEEDEINDIKKCVVVEFGGSGGVVWVIEGCEIENYVDLEVLYELIVKVYCLYVCLVKCEKYDYVLYFYCNKFGSVLGVELYKDVDKVKIVWFVCDNSWFVDCFGLKEKFDEVIELIWCVNF